MKYSQSDPLDWIEGELADLESAGLRRALATHGGAQLARLDFGDGALVHFGSNDYLGLAADPRLSAAAAETARDEGWGAGASPLVTGHAAAHERLERSLAEFEGTQGSLLFSSGYTANVGSIAALAGRGDAIYSDQSNHASIIDGCRLSRAETHVFLHRDLSLLESRLQNAAAFRRRLIVTESVFSMDGDLAPLVELVELAKRYQCMLLVDEAHATGVFGRHGRGLAEQLGVAEQIDVRIGTFSKALGCAGGFVCGRQSLVDWLVNRARPYIFSTAGPPALSAAAQAALVIVRDEPQRRVDLLARAADLRDVLRQQGWQIGASESQIIPLVVGDVERALVLSRRLRERGLFVPAIRPPSVPEGQALLRISLCWSHSPEMVEQLTGALASLAADFAPLPSGK